MSDDNIDLQSIIFGVSEKQDEYRMEMIWIPTRPRFFEDVFPDLLMSLFVLGGLMIFFVWMELQYNGNPPFYMSLICGFVLCPSSLSMLMSWRDLREYFKQRKDYNSYIRITNHP